MTRFEAGPGDSPGFLLWHVTLRWQRHLTSALAPVGLTHTQFVLLACTWWLNEQGVHPNQLTVATQAGTDVKMASEVLRRLEARGLLARHADQHDSRARALAVTPVGAELAAQAIVIVEAADQAFFAGQSQALTEVLRPLVAERSAVPAPAPQLNVRTSAMMPSK